MKCRSLQICINLYYENFNDSLKFSIYVKEKKHWKSNGDYVTSVHYYVLLANINTQCNSLTRSHARIRYHTRVTSLCVGPLVIHTRAFFFLSFTRSIPNAHQCVVWQIYIHIYSMLRTSCVQVYNARNKEHI